MVIGISITDAKLYRLNLLTEYSKRGNANMHQKTFTKFVKSIYNDSLES